MSYSQTLSYLYSQLPMFHRIGAAAYKADLDNTIAICNVLGHPYKNFKSIHIAGTNGKGSTAHMLSAILQSAGYKTGLYTSPHLKDFRERIRVNGKMISKKKVVDFVQNHKQEFEKIKPSFFEWTVGLCFDYFSEEKVDIAVIETGLGGRLDSTNVITPILSVITNIGWDHMNLLGGGTLEKIAFEKAGIIKRQVPVVIGETQEIKSVFEKAKDYNAPIFFADRHLKISKGKHDSQHYCFYDIRKEGKIILKDLKLDLTGNYQEKNILTVLKSVEILREKGITVTEENLRNGLKQVKKLTGLAGRWEILSREPLIIADTAHNEDGIRYVLQQLQSLSYKKLHFVLGLVSDKNISGILKLLPKEAIYYFCKADIPRALEAGQLALQAKQFDLEGKTFHSVTEALAYAKVAAEKNDLIFIGGSTFTVAEVI